MTTSLTASQKQAFQLQAGYTITVAGQCEVLIEQNGRSRLRKLTSADSEVVGPFSVDAVITIFATAAVTVSAPAPIATFSTSEAAAVRSLVSGGGIYAASRMTAEQLNDVASFAGAVDVTDAVFGALAEAKDAQSVVVYQAGKYKLSGSDSLEFDLGLCSVQGNGIVIFDCSGITAEYAVKVFSSREYPESMYTNTLSNLSGIVFIGGRVSGRHGMLVGSDVYPFLGQCGVENCAVDSFDRNKVFGENGWRTKFTKFVSRNALTKTFYVPLGITNAGEAMAFYHCMYADGGSFDIAADGWTANLFSTSILNCPVNIDGVTAKVNMFGGNLELPNATTGFTYATLNGSGSALALNGTTLTIGNYTFSEPVFNAAHAQSTLSFSNITWPDSNSYTPETTIGVRAFCGGPGRVIASVCEYWPASGANKICLGAAANRLANGNFEAGSGAPASWSVSAYGSPGSTAVASATAKKNGTYGLLVTTVAGGGISAAQSTQCVAGQLVQFFAWGKVATNGGAPCGYVTVVFKDAAGNTIVQYGDELVASGAWVVYGSTQTRYAPAGTATVEAVLNAQASASANVVYFDDVVLNVT